MPGLVIVFSRCCCFDPPHKLFQYESLYKTGSRVNFVQQTFAIFVFRADPDLQSSELGIAFATYLDMIRCGRILDPYVKDWLKG